MAQPPLLPQLFPVEEYRSRLAALRTIMAKRHIDLLIVDQFEHMTYFGGYRSTAAMYQALLTPLVGEPVAVIRALDAPVSVKSAGSPIVWRSPTTKIQSRSWPRRS
ncbi:aminopeptidase P family N-terminal domain-containing protein [Sinorhizobium meliloti]|uniref:aminopeptidase P family N-terminal domain-containing protein n=1 Tax=Rhizobium meliloti TaxID=382 RepID=UPI0012950100|nr:aminopeptidase P family N-terminal domain-containing protein [Sinorhizobium meliloti]MQX93368.1 hypothetical protein [Sinorhizobium meliloti]